MRNGIAGTIATLRGTASRLRRQLGQFRHDETGALVIFALMLAVLMMMMGGIAVDVMRYESRRTSLQNTLDRSTLAAAALNQTQDPEAVVNDYFLKAGLLEYLTSVTVTENLTSREVKATAAADAEPLFMHLMGIDQFEADGVSAAEQSISNVEIALVLDVSGSMSGTKIANLRTAAQAFVDTVKAGDDDHHVSISIVPYNAQVNLGPALRSKFQVTHEHGVAGYDCVEPPDSVFSTTYMPRNVDLPMYAHADFSNSTNRVDGFVVPTDPNYAVPDYSDTYCRTEPGNVVRLPNDDAATIKAHIGGLTAAGNTSIVLGLKWGEALLDPDMRSTFDQMIADGDIPGTIPDRPFDYGNEGLKVIVLMTDGEHVSHTIIPDAYKSGPSPIYYSTGDGNYSIYHSSGRPAVAGSNTYWVPHLASSSAYAANGWKAAPWDSGDGVVQLDWRDVWASLRLKYVAWQLYGRALGTDSSSRTSVYNATVAAMTDTWKSASQMDTLLQTACAAARADGIIIYGIAFQASTSGQTQIRNCSTDGASGSHYFNATTLNIASAFQTIASNISQLRLTQ